MFYFLRSFFRSRIIFTFQSSMPEFCWHDHSRFREIIHFRKKSAVFVPVSSDSDNFQSAKYRLPPPLQELQYPPHIQTVDIFFGKVSRLTCSGSPDNFVPHLHEMTLRIPFYCTLVAVSILCHQVFLHCGIFFIIYRIAVQPLQSALFLYKKCICTIYPVRQIQETGTVFLRGIKKLLHGC